MLMLVILKRISKHFLQEQDYELALIYTRNLERLVSKTQLSDEETVKWLYQYMLLCQELEGLKKEILL